MVINSLQWNTNYSPPWRWKIASEAGGDAMFVKEVNISNISFETSYAYKGFGWESFYKTWHDRLTEVKELAGTKEFATQVSSYVDWVSQNNTAAKKEIFEQHFRPLNYKSRETFLSVV